jgi:hypothetical protein
MPFMIFMVQRLSSLRRHSAFARPICLGVRHSGAKSFGLATMIAAAFARDVATLRRFAL